MTKHAATTNREEDRAEAIRSLKWIKEFCEAHHAGEPFGVHLHRLLVDIPHYLDYVLAVLDGEWGHDVLHRCDGCKEPCDCLYADERCHGCWRCHEGGE